MEEETARLALLQTELTRIHEGIRGLDNMVFQIKGWCVTAALAIGGFAVVYHRPALLMVGSGAVIGFYLIDCQFKAIQYESFTRNKANDVELKRVGLMPFLKGTGSFGVVGTAPPEPSSLRDKLMRVWDAARAPQTFGLYLFIILSIGVEALILL